ncbi:uncharacterized protein J3R85_006062 [Psidium guajava]|nr:uncharacterized protein J3R85_006062 [Psidium guajava]
MHLHKGHYIKHGRGRRFQILDRWWNRRTAVVARERQRINNKSSRSRLAGLTQDSLFWAKVEEAKDWLEQARKERDSNKLEPLLANLKDFEEYAKELIGRKEVSIDVLAKNSSYSLWAEGWKALFLSMEQEEQEELSSIRSFASEAFGRANTFKEIKEFPHQEDGCDLSLFTQTPEEYFGLNPKPKSTYGAGGSKRG